MRQFKNLVVVLLFTIVSCKQAATTSESIDPKSNKGIQLGLLDSIHSEVLNQDRELIIYLPESAKDPSRRKEQYPVVYLLDGGASFVPFVGMLKMYSEMNDTKILPEMIVVGIPNIDFKSRMMDLSPTPAGNSKQYGGGNRFLEFIRTELFPLIEQKYPASKHRTIVGHSLGGAAVMNVLTKHPEMFDNYLMIDGSLSFDNELFLKNPDYNLKGKDLKDKNLFIAIANTATYGSDLESIKKDTIQANKFVRHSLKLVDQIERMDTALNMEWKYYKDDTHGSTAFSAQKDGLRYFYSWFEFKTEFMYRTRYFKPQTKEETYANLTRRHFDSLSQRFGYTFRPDKEWLSSSAYMLLNFHKQPKQAKEVFELNTSYYPKDASTFKDLGDFYISQQDTVSANSYYKKALALDKLQK